MNESTPPDIVSAMAGDDRQLARIEAQLDEAGRTRSMRRALLAIVVLVIAFLAWAAVAQVDELARARGEVQPAGNVQSLQSEEGGTIGTLYVEEGERVTRGQNIADFTIANLDRDQAQATARMDSFAIDLERLGAFVEDRAPDFSAFENRPEMVREARATLRSQVAARDAAIAAKRNEAEQQQATLRGIQSELRLLERELAEGRTKLRRIEDGASKGLISRLQLSEERQQVSELELRYSDARSRAESLRNTIESLESDLERLRAEFAQEASTERGRIVEQLSELEAEMAALNEREGRTLVVAPVDGVVIKLPETREGAVLPPGGTIAEIVPTDGEILMEAQVSPRDIGFVRTGQRATVKFDAFDYSRFGAVEGEVKQISPTSFKMPETGTPYYKVRVALATSYVGNEERRLIPGMTGEVDIATGRKTVLQFILKPVFITADTAFHER